MRRTLWTLLIATGCITVGAVGCLNVRTRRVDQRNGINKSVLAEIDRARPQIDEQKVTDFFFETRWDSYISDEILTMVTLQGKHIYVYTESNRLYQIDLETGLVKWVYDVGEPLDFQKSENPISVYVYPPKQRQELGRYDEVFFIAKDVLYALDLDSGSELWRMRLPFSASAPPAATATHVHIGGWDDRIHAYNKDTQERDWFYRTNNDIRARPAANSEAVFVSSSDNHCYRFLGGKGDLQWKYPTAAKLTQDPWLNDAANLLYLPSNDYTMYVINTLDGRLEWRHETGGAITCQPVAIGRNVYSVSEIQSFQQTEIKKTSTLIAYERGPRVLGKTQHKVLWKREGATQFLASGVENAYFLEPTQGDKAKILKLDQKKGFFRDALEVSNVDFYAKNTFPAGSRKTQFTAGIIVLGYRNGWIIALKELPKRS